MNFEETIAKLTEELDSETVAELVAQFLSDTPEQISLLREAAARGDLKLIERTAHSLGGSSSAFGLTTMQDAAHVLEKAAGAAEQARLAGQIEALAAAYAGAKPQLEQLIRR